MRFSKDHFSWAIIVLALAALVTMRVQRGADDGGKFPSRPLSIICPYPAGGGTDMLARALARSAEETLGQTITVNNITGGGGAVGFAAGLLAPPDGYTVTMVTFELVSLPLQGMVPFQHADFDLLLRVNMDPAALTVKADCPANTVEEFIAWANARGGVSIGNSGPGSVWHFAAALMAGRLGISANFIPFAGANPAVTALVGGHVDAVTVSPGEVRTQVEAGLVKVLGIMAEERLPSSPDVPTFRELGHDVTFGTWRGLAVPKHTPEPVRQRLIDGFGRAMRSGEFTGIARRGALNLAFADAAEFTAQVDARSHQVAELMRELGFP